MAEIPEIPENSSAFIRNCYRDRLSLPHLNLVEMCESEFLEQEVLTLRCSTDHLAQAILCQADSLLDKADKLGLALKLAAPSFEAILRKTDKAKA